MSLFYCRLEALLLDLRGLIPLFFKKKTCYALLALSLYYSFDARKVEGKLILTQYYKNMKEQKKKKSLFLC